MCWKYEQKSRFLFSSSKINKYYFIILNIILLIFLRRPILSWNFLQWDVKTTFLNGVVEEEVYVEQPLCFETHDRESHVCILKKDLYGLR